MKDMSVTRDTSHLEMSPLKDLASLNMPFIVVTLDTSHFEMSPLKEFSRTNNPRMSVTLDTSHSAIGPYRPVGQSPFGERSRHPYTALRSSSLDENAPVVVHTAGDIDPGEPVNMFVWLAFDCTQ